jgi:hypothetical protein
MAQNICRVQKQFTIDLLSDYLHFYKGFSYTGQTVPIITKEGKAGV